MDQIKLTELSDQELLQELKKLKTAKTTKAIFIGVLFGIFVYSAVKNGFTFFTFFPLFFVFLLFSSGKKKNEFEIELKNEISARNIEQ